MLTAYSVKEILLLSNVPASGYRPQWGIRPYFKMYISAEKLPKISNNSPSNKYTLLGTVINEIEIAGVDCQARGCADRFWLATVCHPSSLE